MGMLGKGAADVTEGSANASQAMQPSAQSNQLVSEAAGEHGLDAHMVASIILCCFAHRDLPEVLVTELEGHCRCASGQS
jgi:hypothetical protein